LIAGHERMREKNRLKKLLRKSVTEDLNTI